jgi:hypothetical protein
MRTSIQSHSSASSLHSAAAFARSIVFPNRKSRRWLAAAFIAALACVATAQVPQLVNYQGRVAVNGVNFNGPGAFRFALVNAGVNVSVQATATAVRTGAFITSVSVTHGGAGYGVAPVVTFSGGGGTGATAQATVAGGVVTEITVLNAGSGYSSLPTVVIAPPPANLAYTTYWSNDGTSTGGTRPAAAVSLPVTKGLYSVLLGDTSLTNMAALPAGVFAHADVRLRVWFDDGVNGPQLLAPDQRIAAVGYAMMANSAQSAQTVADGAITADKIADGAVSSAKIAAGAVGGTQLATGAVSADKIAPGAITSTQLAKPPRSGTVASSSLDIQFNQAAFTVPFSPPFGTPPVITLGVRAASGTAWQPTVWITASATASFSGRFAVPAEPVVPDSSGGSFASLLVVDGNPAVAYNDISTSDLKFIRATDPSGTAWAAPVTLDSDGIVGYFAKLALVNGNPAVAYLDSTNSDLKFIRATDASGTAWGTPAIIDSESGVTSNGAISLAVINGYPAIAYYDPFNDDLKFVRATDENGTAWGTPAILDSEGDVGTHASLAVVNGNPAVAYRDQTNKHLKFVRATDPSGTAWAAPATLDSNENVGGYASLAVVDGNPAIAYCDFNNDDLMFVRATDASGTVWGTPTTLDSAGSVGAHASLAVVDGRPAVAYREFLQSDLKYIRATNASGTDWGSPITLDSVGSVGFSASLAVVNGSPAIAYCDSTNRDLKFVRPELPASLAIDWIALEP